MAEIVVKDILEAGVHYGHRSSRWNPKMRPYIYGRRNQIHIIDIKETIRGLIRARKYLLKVAAQGGLILFVGTKRQAAASIEELATECRMPFCTERWRQLLLLRRAFGYHLIQLSGSPQVRRQCRHHGRHRHVMVSFPFWVVGQPHYRCGRLLISMMSGVR